MIPLFETDVRQVLWNKLYRRSVFEGFTFPTMNPCSDVATCYQLVGAANKVAFVPRPLVFYRIHDQSMSAYYKPKPTYLPYRLPLYNTMLDYAWERFPAGREAYRAIARRELQALEKRGLMDQADPDVVESLETKAHFSKRH